MSEERILAGLDEEQREVASNLSGPMCVLAGAGTGKTRAITHRIALGVHSGVYVQQQLLAVTFTARAAGEMRTRLRELGAPLVQARTFHSAALRQLQYFWPQAVGGSIPQLVDHKAPHIAEAVRRLRLSADRALIRDLASEIEWAKVSMLTADSYVKAAEGRARVGDLEPQTVARLFSAYEDVKKDRVLIDFEDVLLLTVAILEEDPRILGEIHRQYRHFTVDEYQDVSPLQERLLKLWVGDRNELCVVGDASQTIYSFTGATPRHLLEFSKTYPDAKVVRLIRDYRSTPQVVQLANKLLESRRIERNMPDADVRWPQPLHLVSQRESGRTVEFKEFPDDEAEASSIAARIKDLVDHGTSARDIAILLRTNGQTEAYERALSAAGLSYQLRGGERFFQRNEIREAMMLLRAAAKTRSGEPASGTVAELLMSIGYSAQAPESGGATRERWESLSALVTLSEELGDATTEGPAASLGQFVAEMEARAATQHAPQVEGVTVASLHSAKGLEWGAVFLAGLSEGLLPISFAKDQAGYDEERRLLYVGITRARDFLHLSWSLARTPGGRAHRTPSRFLDGLRPQKARMRREDDAAGSASLSRSAPRAKARGPVRCRTCGKVLDTPAERKLKRCLDCPASYDEALLDALKAWRLETSRAAEVPAYVVFTDATLMAIAEDSPETMEALSRISGVGESKLERFGEQVLGILKEHVAE
ncbi:UvrD-helicase domain-containing protein [Neomicrococcus aestuarii]|nr:UvrD-helicase domain-containing protein [Neomicrococcus aestuarii]